jgi:membrane protease YdiL (CAAX protease family)
MGGLLGLPLLYMLMGLVSALSRSKYEHPLIDSASESGQFQTYLFGFFAAAIAAPITEEFFFRVILQGWLQSIPFKSFFANFIGANVSNSATDTNSQGVQEVIPVLDKDMNIEVAAIKDIYASTSIGNGTQNVSASSTQQSAQAIPPIWPSIITGLLFGLAHIEYGVSFVPLTFLGIFLGLIYRQTHSIWPCIIIHMMLNGFSMMMLGLMILMKQAGIPFE